jgi:hypothetical protein
MLRLLKRVAWLGVLAAGLPAAQAFSTGGPIANGGDAWQVNDLGYALPGDLVAPKNIGEDYRRNMPVLYYAFDESFLDYFGSNGVAAVDQAFAILNNLTNVSSYSADLSEIPLEATRFNETAGALNLMDVKSAVLSLIVEQMGLADPIRYAWTLHDRVAGANCPVGNQYLVTKRNYAIVPSDLDQLQYSSYVNGVLFSYYIHDYCAAPVPFGEPLSQAVPIPVDVPINAARFTPVSSWSVNSLVPGSFYSGLTRDDVAGLRYLLRSAHVHWENNPLNSIVFVTNNAPTGLQLIVTSNLTLLAAQSLTNDDAALEALYPDLVIVPGSTIPSFTNVVTTNVTAYYTNAPWAPVGSPPVLQYATNYDTNVMFVYTRQFANVITNPPWCTYSPKSYVTVIDSNITFLPFAPTGSPAQTNTTTTTMLTNMATGDFYILSDTNCGVEILSNVLTAAVGMTNTLIVTNTPTNAVSGTFLLSRTYINWWTNHYLASYGVLCVSNEPSLRRGIEKITFVKTAYDSLLGQFYAPQTNFFTMTTVTNSTNWVQTFQRVATTPDFLFTAVDELPGPAAPPMVYSDVTRTINFNQANVLPGLAGPGTIDPPTTITFNKSGPIFYNTVTNNEYSLDERTAVQEAMWASYDNSTNAPVLYPDGASITSLESQMLMQVTSVTLPPAYTNTLYSTQLTGTGGSGQYNWSLAPNSPPPPSWLGLTPVPSSGQLSGTPTAPGISSFFVQMTDRLYPTNFTVWQVTLTVLP